MIYRLLRWISGIALHWFYREIRVLGRENIPIRGPLLIAANHQNALVDSLIAGWVMPRRITMTAKATLIDNPLIAILFRILGVVPLRRTSDEPRRSGRSTPDRSRNVGAFREILRILEKEGAVLIFPEGKSHNERGLEPLRTGLARLALQARDEQSIKGLCVLPIGLTFEDKAMPGSIVGVRVGEAITMDTWAGRDPAVLTVEIARRMRDVSELAGLPPAESVERPQSRFIPQGLIMLAAIWGRLTHELPIRMARRLALRQSGDADQPAMLTIMFGIGLILLTYFLEITAVGVLARSFWIPFLFLVSLVVGAYWAAFEKHHQQN
jgi:1-acyl-sn-glycerol-3-phosphate acyltransferase